MEPIVWCISQARSNSSRLPKKIFKKVDGKTLLEIQILRVKQSKRIHKFIVATTDTAADNETFDLVKSLGIECYRGSENDVLDRFYQTVKIEKPDYIVRITADCPLVDAELIDAVIEKAISSQSDYCSNVIPTTFPDGQDIEVIRFTALEQAWKLAVNKSDREHVTPFIWRNATSNSTSTLSFTLSSYVNQKDCSEYRMTVDEEKDFELIEILIKKIGYFQSWSTYVNFLTSNQEIRGLNNSIIRNEGFMKSIKENIVLKTITDFPKSDLYRSKIHNLIPGGAHTYSKGDDQFPILSPAAIVRGKGSKVWDLDGNEFIDCSMGLGSVTLGHAYEPVLERVTACIQNGVNFQRPSFLEMEMAEKFLALVPQHDRIKFAKNGSTVVTAAVKLARAYTRKKYVAFPIDHPFYSYDDWFIGKTNCNKGVPIEIQGLTLNYISTDLDTLKKLFEEYPNQIACVVSEPEKQLELEQSDSYLKELIDLVHKHGALFIQDEMVTGFKTDYPGSIKKFNVEPDLATWGKGIANGFSFCALTGKKEIMDLGGIKNTGSERVFLTSTTHGGETHAMVAAMATLDEYQDKQVIKHMHEKGNLFLNEINSIVESHKMNDFITVYNYPWTPVVGFKDTEFKYCQGFRTLFLQEMIKRGVLFQGALVPSFSHSHEDILYIAAAFNESLIIYKKALEDGYANYLVGEPCKPVFRKFN